MNGYKMLADAYRNQEGCFDSQIKALDFLSTCDKKDICSLFDSGAFNELTRAYTKIALHNCNIPKEQCNSVLGELSSLFSEIKAEDIII